MSPKDRRAAPSRTELAAWIRERREASTNPENDKPHTQYSAAKAIDSTVTSISRWETATHPISADDLMALLLLYDAVEEFADFLTRKGTGRKR